MAEKDQLVSMLGQTHPGMEREHNEDAIWMDSSLGLAILADGMGGYNAGEVASGMAVACISTDIRIKLDPVNGSKKDPLETTVQFYERLLQQATLYANQEILETAERQPECQGMGTTLVAVKFYDKMVTVAHVGDARLYRLRNGLLEVMTKDHSLLQEQLDSGLLTPEAARYVPYRNLVTRAVGVQAALDVDVQTLAIEEGDIYLLCSDGLNDMLTDEEIGYTLESAITSPQLAIDLLIQQANDAGGKDNISVIVARVEGEVVSTNGALDWLMPWR